MFQKIAHANDNRKGIISKFVNWVVFSRTCHALESLDDRTLRDLGIARNQIPVAVRVMMNDNQDNSIAS